MSRPHGDDDPRELLDLAAAGEPAYQLDPHDLLRKAKRAYALRRVGLVAATALTALAIGVVSTLVPRGPAIQAAGPELSVTTAVPVPAGARIAAASSVGPCGDGELFGVDAGGDLLRYTDQSRGNACQASVGPGQVIDNGWRGIRQIFADHDTVYALTATGDLRWYRYQPATASWAPGSTGVLTSGWAALRQVTYAGDGVFYAVDDTGRLRWYRHLDPTGGTARWAAGSGRVIDDGWTDATRIFAAGNAIYAMTPAGDLRWYGYSDPLGGNGSWRPGSGSVIDSGGWNIVVAAVAVRDGSAATIYTIDVDGRLRRDQHDTPDTGTDSWAAGSGEVIGTGWLN